MKHASLDAWTNPSRVIGEHLGVGPVWRKIGCAPGPLLVVTGRGAGFDGATRRLKALPTLGYMRGELSVSRIAFTRGADTYLKLEHMTEAETYWRILAAATRLGMISGRGVPSRYLAETDA